MVINVKDDLNDKELEEIPEVKKYFSRIYTVLSKNVKEQLDNLDISKDKKTPRTLNSIRGVIRHFRMIYSSLPEPHPKSGRDKGSST